MPGSVTDTATGRIKYLAEAQPTQLAQRGETYHANVYPPPGEPWADYKIVGGALIKRISDKQLAARAYHDFLDGEGDTILHLYLTDDGSTLTDDWIKTL